MSELTDRIAQAAYESLIGRGIDGPDKPDWRDDAATYYRPFLLDVARACLEQIRILPEAMKDPYWPLSHVKGATASNPIPSMQAAIDAFVDEALK